MLATAGVARAPMVAGAGVPTGSNLLWDPDDDDLVGEPTPTPTPTPLPPPKRSSLARAFAFCTSASSCAGDMDRAASSAGLLGAPPPRPPPPSPRFRPGVSSTSLPLARSSSSSSPEAISSPYRFLKPFARVERPCASPLPPPCPPPPTSCLRALLLGLHNTFPSLVLAFLLARAPAIL